MKSRISTLILLVASLVVAVVLGELILRLLSPDRYMAWKPGLQREFRPAPGLIPGVSGVSQFRINRLGLRGDELTDDFDYRILTLGGSTTECLFLDESETWPRLVQTYLNEKTGAHPRVWVGNGGRSGHDSRNHIVQVEHLPDQIDGLDAVLVMMGINDFLKRLSRNDSYRPFPGVENLTPEEYKALMDESFMVWPKGQEPGLPWYKRTHLWLRLRLLKYRMLGSPPPVTVVDAAGNAYEQWRRHRRETTTVIDSLPEMGPVLDEYERNIETIIRESRSAGVRPIFVTQTYLWNAALDPYGQSIVWAGGIGKYQENPGHPYYSLGALDRGVTLFNERLKAVCRRNDVDCIDLAAQVGHDIAWFYDGMHFNEQGCVAVAHVIADHISQNIPLTSTR